MSMYIYDLLAAANWIQIFLFFSLIYEHAPKGTTKISSQLAYIYIQNTNIYACEHIPLQRMRFSLKTKLPTHIGQSTCKPSTDSI